MRVKTEQQLGPGASGLFHSCPQCYEFVHGCLCWPFLSAPKLSSDEWSGVGRVAMRGDGMHHLDFARKSHPTSENRKSVLRTLVRLKFYNLYALNYVLRTFEVLKLSALPRKPFP